MTRASQQHSFFERAAQKAAIVVSLGLASIVWAPNHLHAAPNGQAGASGSASVDLEALRKRFADGLSLEEDERWEEALAVFEEIAQKRMSGAIRFHIALCHEHLEKLATALSGYEEALAIAKKEDPDKGRDVLDRAPKRIEALTPRVPVLELELEGDPGNLLLDLNPLVDPKTGMTVLVDPGKHRIFRVEGAEKTMIVEIQLSEGERKKARVPSKALQGDDKGKPDKPVTTEGNPIPAFVVGGVGIVGVVLSGVFIGLRQLSISEVRDNCQNGDSGCDPAVRDVAERGAQYEYAAWGLGIGGLACVAAGLALYFTIGQDTTTNVSLSVGASPQGVVLRGKF